jgi:hypothetical protein
VNAKDFFPIAVGKVLPNHPRAFTPVLEPARAMPCYAGQDEMADYSQTMPRPAVPADPDDYFSEADDDYDDALEVRELLAQRPAPTPNGRHFALLQDALATIQDLQRAIGGLDFFSAGDTGLGEATRAAEKANLVLIRAGVRL